MALVGPEVQVAASSHGLPEPLYSRDMARVGARADEIVEAERERGRQLCETLSVGDEVAYRHTDGLSCQDVLQRVIVGAAQEPYLVAGAGPAGAGAYMARTSS
jgi:hypothetical protein